MPKSIEELVAQQVRKSELARQEAESAGRPCTMPVITISRTMGSGARIIAQKLAEELGWSLWDKELLDAMANDAQVSRKVVEAFDERTISEIELLVRSILGAYDMAGFLYLKHLVRAVISIASLGNAIILGRGANFILPGALNVRIDASEHLRIENMMKYEAMSREDAEKRIKKSDKERHQFLVKMFGRERVRNVHYDLTIWMDKFDNDGAVEIIKTALSAFCRVQTGGAG